MDQSEVLKQLECQIDAASAVFRKSRAFAVDAAALIRKSRAFALDAAALIYQAQTSLEALRNQSNEDDEPVDLSALSPAAPTDSELLTGSN